MNGRLLYTKLSWPAFCLVMMLQRSPIIRQLAEIEFSLLPRTQHLWTALVAGVTVGAYNTVTAASGKVEIAPGSSSTTVNVGEQLRVVLWVGGEKANSPHKPELWEYTGTLPAGVTVEINLNAGTFSLTGIPTEAGQFPISVTAYEKKKKTEGSNDTFDLTIIVEGSGFAFGQHPSDENVPWGTTLGLSATVDPAEGTTYQWQRILSGEANYSDIEGATSNSLNLQNMTKAQEGMYRLAATNGGNTIFSEPAVVSVSATGFQLWQEDQFQNPFALESAMDQDPDKDSWINAFEFAFGLDPNHPEKDPIVQTSHEIINEVAYSVFTYPPLNSDSGIQVQPERKNDFKAGNWTNLQNGVDGIVILNSPESYVIKVPENNRAFSRLHITAN